MVRRVIEFGFHSSSVEGGQTECAIVVRGHLLDVVVCEGKVLSGFRTHSSISKSDSLVPIDLTTRSTKKLTLEPPATGGLGLNSATLTSLSSLRRS